ncbi:YicC/YloC family endoribonuclease [Methyloligella sp. 2.7D]|uniref:YicC/YloC family endoribonuclease n=1 Tax=unclassified Methyloligella TaxID=2625955 RepID=UPI00157C41BE|nr:YicC/YloC family endoribonuclease [Methyloligella sp. GL2]QKP77469.1 YicC family protein [Methyloligella sp. GL2]
MSLKSMTGFARADGVHDGVHWHWEGRSVNGRGLELRFRLPPGFDALEPEARSLCQKLLARGNCSINLVIQREAASAELRLNEASLRQAFQAARRASEITGLPDVSLDSLLAMRGVVEIREGEESETARAALNAALLDGLSQMLTGLSQARTQEGTRLFAVLEDQLAQIAELREQTSEAAARQPDAFAARIEEQVAKLISGSVPLEAERLHQEAALLAAKADIQEELDRLLAHIAAARELIASDGPVGRKLEFLAQELNREANTVCSKAGDVEVSHLGLALKGVIDQFREQVANIE